MKIIVKNNGQTLGNAKIAIIYPIIMLMLAAVLPMRFANSFTSVCAAYADEKLPDGKTAVFPGAESPFYLYVEKGSFSITVFCKGYDGNYSVPLRTFPTAIGRSARMTPTGVFSKRAGEVWHNWGRSYSPYACEYADGLYIHGPLYGATDFDRLYASSVSQIGTAASSGCLRTTAEAAYFFYEYCPEGTQVNIVDGSPIGFFASAPSIDEQYKNPAGMSLDDIFPGYGDAPRSSGALTGAVTRISVSPDSLEFIINESNQNAGTGRGVTNTRQLNATARDGGEAAILWLSADMDIAAVDSNGTVYYAGPGKTDIIALTRDGALVAKCPVTVIYADIYEPQTNLGNPPIMSSSSGHWAAGAVSRLKAVGIVNDEIPKFEPDRYILSVEYIKMLTTATKINSSMHNAAAGTEAGDVSETGDDWYAAYIDEAVKLGILDMNERDAMNENPGALLTREEMSRWTGAAFGYRLSEPGGFADDSDFMVKTTANRLIAKMFINPYSDGTFRPRAPVTRAVAAQVLSNILSIGERGAMRASRPTMK